MTLQQRYKDRYTIFLILLFLGLTLFKASQVFLYKDAASLEVIGLLTIAVVLFLITYFLTKSTLKVKIGKKKISVKLQPFGFLKFQIRKENIDDIDFVTALPLATYGGALIHFGDHQRVFNFGGNKAMVVTLKNGKQYSFISKELYNQKEEILNKVFPKSS